MSRIKFNEKSKTLYLVICIISVSLVFTIYNAWLKTLPAYYTIGVVIKISAPPKGGPNVKYYYYVGNKHFEQFVNVYGFEDIAKPGARFLVKVPIGHDDAGEMLLNNPVPNGIESPDGGWSSIPTFKRQQIQNE